MKRTIRRLASSAIALGLFAATLPLPAAAATTGLPIELGDRGSTVVELQTRLRTAGHDPGPLDGIFGVRTDAAVRGFQTARSLPTTGVVDTATWAALGGDTDPILTLGSRGSRVYELQGGLVAAGHDPGPRDGIYGTRTAAAVSAFQQASGLAVTGKVDQTTWDRLFTPTVILRRGSTGPAVVEVQQRLAATGYPPGVIDGKYGLATAAAVRSFQSAQGLTVTGEVERTTLDRLRALDLGPGAVLLRIGDRGTAVSTLQARLARVGFSPGPIDGGYGERTAAAVARFQSTFRLSGSGAFNEVTERRLTAFEREAERGYAAGYVPGGGAEQWRQLVTTVFARWGLDQPACPDSGNPANCVPAQVEAALVVMNCESKGIPFAVNVTSGVTGMFQHRMTYWAERVGRVRAQFPDFPTDASPYQPEHDVMVAALLVWESRNALVRNLEAGRELADGPHPWSHWSCRRAIG